MGKNREGAENVLGLDLDSGAAEVHMCKISWTNTAVRTQGTYAQLQFFVVVSFKGNNWMWEGWHLFS